MSLFFPTSYDLWLSTNGYPRGLRFNTNDGSASLEWGKSDIMDDEIPDETVTLVGPMTAFGWDWA